MIISLKTEKLILILILILKILKIYPKLLYTPSKLKTKNDIDIPLQFVWDISIEKQENISTSILDKIDNINSSSLLNVVCLYN
jgi:hypothetical protein